MSLADIKAELVDGLKGLGYSNVFDYVPESVPVPAIMVTAGDPYITDSIRFKANEAQVNLDVILVASTKVNKQMSASLDKMIERVILNLGDWTLGEVTAPLYQIVNNSYRLYCIISVSHEFELEN